MGEIKSTLDLVMERTRHLSLSAEEKKKQQLEAFQKRLQGILQQVADGTVRPEAVLEKTSALQQEMAVKDPKHLTQAVIDRIDPDGDNAPWLELIGKLSPEAAGPLQEILNTHMAQQRHLRHANLDRIRERLAEENGIRGSAVEPNPQKDPVFKEELSVLRQAAIEQITAIAGKD